LKHFSLVFSQKNLFGSLDIESHASVFHAVDIHHIYLRKIIFHYSFVVKNVGRKDLKNVFETRASVSFVQGKQAIISASNTLDPLKLVIITKKTFFAQPFQFLFPFFRRGMAERVKIFMIAVFYPPTTNPVRANTPKIVQVNNAGRMVKRFVFVARKYPFDRDIQESAPVSQVKIGKRDVFEPHLFFKSS